MSLLLMGCHGFENPPFKNSDLKEFPELEGDWDMYLTNGENNIPSGDPTPWEIIKTDKNKYLLRQKDKDEFSFVGRFFENSGQNYASLEYVGMPGDPAPEGNLYMVAKIQYTDTLILGTPMDLKHLIYLSKTGLDPFNYETIPDRSSDYNTGPSYIITESTKNIRKIIAKYQNDPKLFPVPPIFLMVKMSSPKND